MKADINRLGRLPDILRRLLGLEERMTPVENRLTAEEAREKKGPPGDSAYQVAVANGFVGDQAAWLASLKAKDGTAATIVVDTVTTLAAGQLAAVTNNGTSTAAKFAFAIPQGQPGQAATISLDTVSTLAAGAPATVTLGGTAQARTISFGIPQGLAGQAASIALGSVTTLAAGSAATVTMGGTPQARTISFGIPQGAAGTPATTLLGTIVLTETAVVAINAGTRRLTVVTPTAWGVTTGQPIIINPVSTVPAGYATHDAYATAANTLSVGITAPLLAIGASYSITCQVRRING